MKTVKLKVISHDAEKEQELTLNFEEQELKTINQYIENCEKLKGAPLLKNFPAVRNIKWDFIEPSVKFEVSDFKYEQVYDLLHRARPIFLHQEPASFNKVKAIFGKKSRDTNLAKLLKEVGADYEKGEYQRYFQVYVGKIPQSARDQPKEWLDEELKSIKRPSSGSNKSFVPLFHEKTLDAWLNGIEYHQDQDKAETVKRIEEHLTKETARGIFVSQLSGRLKAVFWLEKLSQLVLNYETDSYLDEMWDYQLKSDLESGKLDSFIKKAEADIVANQVRELDEVLYNT